MKILIQSTIPNWSPFTVELDSQATVFELIQEIAKVQKIPESMILLSKNGLPLRNDELLEAYSEVFFGYKIFQL